MADLQRTLRALRTLSGVPRSTLESACGLTQGYLSRVESGQRRPSRTLAALLILLAAHPDRLREIE